MTAKGRLEGLSHRRGSLPDVQDALRRLAYDHIALGVRPVGLIMTFNDYGWRRLVLRVCLWAIQRAGHILVPHDRS